MTLDAMLAREAIRDTMARYTMAGDGLRADAFSAVFTPDAILESDGVAAPDAFRFVGHAAIRSWITRWSDRPAGAPAHAASFVRHHLATSLIEIEDRQTARARTYWTAYTDIGADHGGVYLDTFHKIGERWLIAHRRVRLDWRAPGSLFAAAITRTR